MQFRLVYDEQVQSRQQAGLKAVHEIRRRMSPQIKKLWEYPPLSQSQNWLNNEGNYHSCIRRDGAEYASVVNEKVGLYGELDILILRPQPPGSVVSRDGDLDNKLKTLIDALTVPTLQQQKDLHTKGVRDDEKLFCVFSDDNLISKLSVTSDRLLVGMEKRAAVIVVTVVVKVGRPSIDNLHLV